MSRRFAKDYRTQYAPDPKTGRDRPIVTYLGTYHKIELPQERIRQEQRWALALWAVQIVLFVAAGLLNTVGGYRFYVMLPYTALLLPVFFGTLAALRFQRVPERMTRQQKDRSVDSGIRCGYTAAAFAAAAVIGTVAVLLLGVDNPAGDILFALCMAASFAAALVCARRLRKIAWRQLQNEAAGGEPLADEQEPEP